MKLLDVGFKYEDGVHTPTVLIGFAVNDWKARDAFAAALSQPHASAQEAAPAPLADHPKAVSLAAHCCAKISRANGGEFYTFSGDGIRAYLRRLEAAPNAPAPVQAAAPTEPAQRKSVCINAERGSSQCDAWCGMHVCVPLSAAQGAAPVPAEPRGPDFAGYLAGIVETWVDMCLKDGKDWRPALANVIERRLWLAPATPAPVAADTLTEEPFTDAMKEAGHAVVGTYGYRNGILERMYRAMRAASPARAIPAQGAAPVPAEPVREPLRDVLREVRRVLHAENENPFGAICDTIWRSDYETLFDYIDEALGTAQSGDKP